MWITILLGLIGSCTTIVVSFFPPDNVDIGSPLRYLWMIGIGNILTLSPLMLFFWYKNRQA
jgi:hypothetical protein